MKKLTMFACVALTLVFALGSWAGELPVYTDGNKSVLYGGGTNFSKASGDTIDLMGPLGTYSGNFEAKAGVGAWTSLDITKPTVTHFSRSTVNNDIAGIDGTSAWCGDTIAACSPEDPAWGYGNNWNELIEFRKAVTNTAVSTTLVLTGNLFHDSEPGYDYTEFGQLINNTIGLQNVGPAYDGQGSEVLNVSFTWLPAEYLNGNQIVMQVRFRSDGGWSDGDCSYQSRGACNLDNLTVTASGGLVGVYTDDFILGWGNWTVAFPDGVGDFAKIWSGLEDEDPCNTNNSNQVAFIDDGVVVPGTGGSDCVNWCYGPSGYIVNTTGGLAGPASYLYNAIESPVMSWPNAACDGIRYAFTVFRHEDLSADAPGMFYTWSVRSADTDNSAGNGVQVITDQAWQDRNSVYYGGPDYLRAINDVTDLMQPGRDQLQVQLAVYELGWMWGWTGNDGYPAPYFDNVNVKIFPVVGPSIVARDIDIANDNFPERQTIDTGNLGSHSVRFDMARNISPAAHLRNDPGDSIVLDVVPVRTGSVLNGNPVMKWALDPNPLFNAYRTSPLGLAVNGTWVGIPAVGISGLPDPDAWQFDLPDTGFLYPGDKLHYYIEASDNLLGNITTATLPADITGYGDFSHPLAYNTVYTINALPSIHGPDIFGAYSQPPILFLNDFGNGGGEEEWYGAFDNSGLLQGRDYDAYTTNGPSSGVGNGIGGRAIALTLSEYWYIFYTSGDLSVNTISNGDPTNDAGNDVEVLTNWLDLNGRRFVATGDDLAADLAQSGAATQTFLQNYMGLSFVNTNIFPQINSQASPTVRAIFDNGVFANGETWIAYGGCPGVNDFDEVNPLGGFRLAEFLDPNGLPFPRAFSAATINSPPTAPGSLVISMPYDLQFIYTDPNAKAPAPLPIRAMLVQEILGAFGIYPNPGDVTDVPGAQKFATKNYPNPFNPTTKIEFAMPKEGHLTLKIYNVRGELVRTLVDDVVAASGSVLWDGTSDSGSSVSSGVYFYEARYGSEVQVRKMTMIK